jgi:hypothetical protein
MLASSSKSPRQAQAVPSPPAPHIRFCRMMPLALGNATQNATPLSGMLDNLRSAISSVARRAHPAHDNVKVCVLNL